VWATCERTVLSASRHDMTPLNLEMKNCNNVVYLKILVNLVPMLPIFQLEPSSLPYVSAAVCGLPGLDGNVLLLTDRVFNDDGVVCRAKRPHLYIKDVIKNHLNSQINSLNTVTEFDVISWNYLEKLSVICPNELIYEPLFKELSRFTSHCQFLLQSSRTKLVGYTS